MFDSRRSIRSNSNKRPRSGTTLRNEQQQQQQQQSPPEATVEDKSTPPLETPRVLTKSSVNSLTHGLDASDVLECYALVRSAPLHGIANSSITIQKMTIGIRFRPKAADLKNPFNVKTPMELTLEYGPARLGPLLSDEAMPIVQGNDESSSYLAWDNAAKVYYTQKIVAENFLSSHYMASMTGAVLNKLLTEAVEYTENRRVYQPFAIYSDTDKLLLRSSSSADFAWFVWSHLAKLGVEIEPILPPAMYDARLYTKSISKVFPDQDVVREAATFYQRLYNCMESIATNNYASFLSSKQQTAIGDGDERPPAPKKSPNTEDGEHRYLGSKTDHVEDKIRSRQHSRKERELDRTVEEIDTQGDEVTQEDLEASETEINKATTSEATDTFEAETTEDQLEEITAKNSTVHDESTIESGNDEEPSNVSDQPNTYAPTDQSTSDGSETLPPTASIHDVEKAQNAANDAQKAADEAKIAAQTEGETKAADAAQAAADAALAAADATSSAASQAAMDSILSGDGTMMSSIVSTCFSNPRYEISSPDANRTVPVGIYLFRDPSTYYKLELTSPYLEVTKLNRPLPRAASMLSDFGAGGDALDWTLAITIFLSMFLMVLLICQQMGKRYVVSIFKCQRWFFDPRNHNDDMELTSGVHSGSHFFFGKNGIPVSMGGKQSSYSPLKNGETLQNMIVDEPFTDEDGNDTESDVDPLSPQGDRRKLSRKHSPARELEMVNFGSDSHPRLQTPRMRPYKDNADSSQGSSEADEIHLEIPDRLLRHPDHVELPSLKSKSKVAIPVGTTASGTYSKSSSFAESSANSAD